MFFGEFFCSHFFVLMISELLTFSRFELWILVFKRMLLVKFCTGFDSQLETSSYQIGSLRKFGPF